MTDNEIMKREEQALASQTEGPLGFDDDDADDMIIPRVKIIQLLSPERKNGEANEGDIINSLTKEKLNGKKFIPVFKFNNNILWADRSNGGGILCMARDGKVGVPTDGSESKMCAKCRKCEFDNTKQGREAIPTCTKFINFFGFFEGERMPIILSFGKTNYNEGKKMYSLAKVTMQNIWNHAYELNDKTMAKNGNEWSIIAINAAGVTSDEDREFAMGLFKQFRGTILNYDLSEGTADEETTGPNSSIEGTEF